MTQIDPALLVSLTQALGTPPKTVETRREPAAPARSTSRRRTAEAGTGRLTALVRQRIRQLGDAGNPAPEDVLLIAIQETLAMEFGEEIATHPRFGEVVSKIHATLSSIPEFARALPALGAGRN